MIPETQAPPDKTQETHNSVSQKIQHHAFGLQSLIKDVIEAHENEEDAIIDEGNGIITVGIKEDIVFYRLRSSGKTKLKINRITVQDGKVAITYEMLDE